MAASGEKLVATATAYARVDTSGTTTSGSYTGTLTGAASCGTAFVAPPSGKVTILFATAAYPSGANFETKTTVWVGTGSTVGAGTETLPANDNNMILFQSTATGIVYRTSSFAEVSGLTAGNTYNVQLRHKVSAGTGTFLYRTVKVLPDV